MLLQEITVDSGHSSRPGIAAKAPQTGMQWFAFPLLVGGLAISPLIIGSGWLLNYLTSPKPILLAIFTGSLLCLLSWRGAPTFRTLLSSPVSRMFLIILAAQGISIFAASWWSSTPVLSLNGTRWRTFGTIPRVSILIFGAGAMIVLAHWRWMVVPLVRAMCAAGLTMGTYALFQAVDLDPWIPSNTYREGSYVWDGLRSPGTLGHANYLANFLLYGIFLALALIRCECRTAVRLFAGAAAVVATMGVFVSGTRAAVLGICVGVICWLVLGRRTAGRTVLGAGVVLACAVGLVAVTPLATPIRERMEIVRFDSSGGPRVLLWKDATSMALRSPLVGYGPETFSRHFPLHQSERLAASYPNHHHESPHNIFLDAWIEQGIAGPLLLLIGLLFSLWSFLKSEPQSPIERELGRACACALIAATVSQQFSVFVIPTALYFVFHQALLIVFCLPPSQQPVADRPRSLVWRLAPCMAGLTLIAYGVLYFVTDYRLGSASQLLAEGRISEAVSMYESSQRVWLPVPDSALWYSRALHHAARNAGGDWPDKTWRSAVAAGLQAVHRDEEKHNAYYWLSILYGGSGDEVNAEAMLRAAIAAAPQWYAPRWMLSQLLQETGRVDEGRRLRELAIGLNGGRTP